MPHRPHILLPLVLVGLALPAIASQILLIEDSPSSGDRFAKDAGSRGWGMESLRSAQEFQSDLEALGHAVVIEAAGGSDPATWFDYDLLVWSSSDHPLPLSDPAWRAALRHYVLDGGHLLIEGGDIAYYWILGDPLFAEKVLHGQSWLADPSGFMDLFEDAHPLANVPNILPGSLFPDLQSYTDADAIQPMSDAIMLYRWTDTPLAASLLAYDADIAPSGGQILYFPFRYSALDPSDRLALLENGIYWLTTLDTGDSSFSGQVHLVGESDHSGVKIQVQPGGHWVDSTVDGSFLLDGLTGGMRYHLVASKPGFRSAMAVIDLEEGEQVDSLYFSLDPVVQLSGCREPNLPIPDDDYQGLADSLPIQGSGIVGAVEVFVDISHSWIGDLVIYLESPAGATCLLQLRGGGNLDEIYGWYPTELDPVQDLGLFINQPCEGNWILHVADEASSDVGTLNAWCLRITVNDGSSVDSGSEPSLLRLPPNWPNPFNPKTCAVFQLSRDADLDLSVIDPAGRLIRELLANRVAAGEHRIEWDGRDDRGRPVPSGLYLLRAKAEGRVRTRNLMLLK